MSGPKRGQQTASALLPERAPPGKPLDRDRAPAQLAKRCLTGHRPAALKGFLWGSGLKTPGPGGEGAHPVE